MKEAERWEPIEGYEGLYEVSSHGRVRYVFSWAKAKSGEMKRLVVNRYAQAEMMRDGVRRIYSVHRLVAQAFIPNPENKPQVNHKDLNKLNNHVGNLEWCTASENQQHGSRMGRNGAKGREKWAKLTPAQVSEIRAKLEAGKRGIGVRLAREYGVAPTTISAIKCGDTWANV